MAQIIEISRTHKDVLSQLVSALEQAERVVATAQAMRDSLLAMASRLSEEIAEAAGGDDEADLAPRLVASEIAAAVRLSDRAVQSRMGRAALLVEDFPATFHAQCQGDVSSSHVRVITSEGSQIADLALRAGFEREALRVAGVESPGRLKKMIGRIAQRYQPQSFEERHQSARATRHVSLFDIEDGMSILSATLPSVLAHGVFDRLTQMAHAVKAENTRAARDTKTHRKAQEASVGGSFLETRDADMRGAAGRVGVDSRGVDGRAGAWGVDGLRADLLSELLLTGVPTAHDTPEGLLSSIRGRVAVTVPVFTLMGVTRHQVMRTLRRGEVDHADTPGGSAVDGEGSTSLAVATPTASLPGDVLIPAELDGAIPVDVESARILANLTPGWDRILTHPLTARILSVDRYRPSEEMRRFLRARDERCRFMGCTIPAWKCDLDHHHDAALGGKTEEHNLGDFCRRHHVTKHQTPWKVKQRPGGIMEWTSPTGSTYIDKPPIANTVVFAPVDTPQVEAPPPF